MTAPRAFGPGELDGVDGVAPDDLAAETRIARDLEALAGVAAGSTAGMTTDFVDRVMAAVDAEPVAAPVRVAGEALRRGAFGAFLASFGDAWRVATRSGFPAVVRAQALALVVVVAALAAGTGAVAAGAVGLIRGDQGRSTPPPSLEAPSPAVAPSPSTSPAVESPSPESPSPEAPSPEPSATDESPTATPARTRQPTASPDDHGGGGGGGGGDDNGGQRTPKPTVDDSGHGGGDNSGPGGGGGGGSGGDDGADRGSGSGSDDATDSPDDD